METVTSVVEMQARSEQFRLAGKRIGVVPTMGFLHEGHLSLMRIARQNANIVITTIFVNPTQFAPNEDFAKYPRNIQRDTELASSAGSDILFTPCNEEIYPKDYATFVSVENLTTVLEGKIRPTHFRGVTTIVAKLFSIVRPHVAVFGQKDAQQAIVIQRMARDLNFGIDIIVAPIVREPDGLAMSSRNVYLSPDERHQATVLSRSLLLASKLIHDGERKASVIVSAMTDLIRREPSATIDYVSIAHPESLQELDILRSGERALISLAVRIGVTRLIDNNLVTI